jgi:hypothetical protein
MTKVAVAPCRLPGLVRVCECVFGVPVASFVGKVGASVGL